MAVTVTMDAILNTNPSFNSAGRAKVAFGTIDCTGQSAAPGGVTMTIPGFNNVAACIIAPNLATSSFAHFAYDITNGKLEVFAPQITTTALASVVVEVASGSDLSGLDSVQFFAVGS